MKYNDEEIKETVSTSSSMHEACVKLGMHFNTFKRHALRLGIYSPNTTVFSERYHLKDILNGKHPQYPTYKLKKRLISEGVKKKTCETCGITKWQDKEISMELDHIDGDRYNHELSNLRILCPNCHSQTPTYRSRNRKLKWLKICLNCNGKFHSKKKKFCSQKCANKYNRKNNSKTKIIWPSREVLLEMVSKHGYSKSGRILGVSDNAIRKHLKKDG